MPLLVAVLTGAAASPVHGQTRTWILGALTESPELVVPIATLDSRDDSGREWSLGVVGWTLQGRLARRTHERRGRFLEVALTPFNADYSNYIYREGRLDEDATYRATSGQVALGVEIDRRNGTKGRYAVVGDFRYVRDLAPEIEERWRHPYVGVEIAERWQRVTGTESFGTRITGVDVGAVGRILFGNRTWSQLELDAHAGRRVGRAFGQLDVGAFTGHGLDTVNAFLIGGSWHLADARLTSGHRFGESRLDRALTASGRASVRVIGALEIGARASAAAGPAIRQSGMGIEMRIVQAGVVADAGIAWATNARSTPDRRPVVYLQFTAAVLQR